MFFINTYQLEKYLLSCSLVQMKHKTYHKILYYLKTLSVQSPNDCNIYNFIQMQNNLDN